MMDYKLINPNEYGPNTFTLTIRCPRCRNNGVFESVKINDIRVNYASVNIVLGLRKCPDPECWRPVFFVANPSTGKILQTFPRLRIDFDDSDIPEKVKSAFNEALDCHANGSIVASAIMIRKTLEELCHDQGATGKTLVDRIEALKTKVLFPQEIFDALHDIRYLGNDAAHLISQNFTVGEKEVEAGIEIAKEVLKALYQFKKLKEKLAALKGQNPSGAQTP